MKNSKNSADQVINVKDIRGNLLYGKDGNLFAYIRATAINPQLMSHEESSAFVSNIASQLASITFPIKIFSIARPIEITNIVENLQLLYRRSNNQIQRGLLQAEMQYLNDLALGGEVERTIYVIVWGKTELEVLRQVQELSVRLVAGRVECNLCQEEEIIRLCNLFANPATVPLDEIDAHSVLPIWGG